MPQPDLPLITDGQENAAPSDLVLKQLIGRYSEDFVARYMSVQLDTFHVLWAALGPLSPHDLQGDLGRAAAMMGQDLGSRALNLFGIISVMSWAVMTMRLRETNILTMDQIVQAAVERGCSSAIGHQLAVYWRANTSISSQT